ncbi:MAG: bifunctional diaminohydroxyphosphoribosylaminopyrimidine deaminase/5-amino-6-(5-phosphoribosylamino)uracil reductase RibD [Planctomycetaceae bacterium]|nr:bifunctional diaminohydroxyphosphoribosylaminopyrimidine deaminase/5-amino-6-(5-phosphoribosylamino)uracil reductase RibD [Planctomycetaceae bacterium]
MSVEPEQRFNLEEEANLAAYIDEELNENESRAIAQREVDLAWMELALAEADRGRGSVEPNPLVGAVLVREGQLVGKGHHARFGGPHAEVMALRDAGEAARGATLYVTLEPCCHHGKTPPCTDAIVSSGVTRVVAAIRDPFPRVRGGGLATLRSAGIDVELGLRCEAAALLNAPYLKRIFTGLPHVTAKWAMTLDGKTAVASGESRWISSPASRALVHQLRGQMDAILVGIGTALADDPMLSARPPGPRTALRIVLDSKALLPISSKLVQTAREIPVLVATTAAAPAQRREALQHLGCEVIDFGQRPHVPVLDLLAELGRRDMTNLLIEGGGKILGAFLEAGQVDAVDAFIAPILEGGDHSYTPARGIGALSMSAAARLQGVTVTEVEGDLRIRGILPQPWRSILSELT